MGRTEKLDLVLKTLDLLEREIRYFVRTRDRLFRGGAIEADWVRSMEQDAALEERTEAFAAKFNRLQDMFGDKLLPRLLSWLGEKPAPFIDALRRAEKLGFVQSADDWLLARELRNKLVHEYVADPQEFADALNTARRLGTDLIESFSRVKDYVNRHRDV